MLRDALVNDEEELGKAVRAANSAHSRANADVPEFNEDQVKIVINASFNNAHTYEKLTESDLQEILAYQPDEEDVEARERLIRTHVRKIHLKNLFNRRTHQGKHRR
jgi:hypothetical protein